MGFPAAGLAGFYRNPREEVKRFLDTRHGDKYRVFNFCPTVENSYPSSTFYGRVSRYPFPDHHAPPIGLLALATQEMAAWLARGPDYTIVVHCKGQRHLSLFYYEKQLKPFLYKLGRDARGPWRVLSCYD
ncbi:Telomerase protein component 1 [Serendipita sp. 411]|nr:Telomerase protein component 1 [Serendipita sp. 411]